MIERLGAGAVDYARFTPKQATPLPPKKSAATMPSFTKDYTATSLVNAYQAFYGINTAKTVSFGASLSKTIQSMRHSMVTCEDKSKNRGGETVGSRVDVSKLINEFHDDLPNIADAVKTNIIIDNSNPQKYIDARTQLKRVPGGIMYDVVLRKPRPIDFIPEKKEDLKIEQEIKIVQDPDIEGEGNTQERSYVLNTKGKLMAVVEDKDDVILTNEGIITKMATDREKDLKIIALQEHLVEKPDPSDPSKTKLVPELKVDYKPFNVEFQPIEKRTPMPSIGEGTEIIIGMEDGRFVPEIIDSINTFIDKINKEEIVLPQFVGNPEAKSTQLAMLAGGFGSRAEYTNASSSAIFHGVKEGTQSTKGIFRTATGLTPMETTFITLHKAGLLDCSKGNLEVGKNLKFYLNKSGVNRGNGDFSVGMYEQMEREGRNSLAIFPNDSMSRMTEATKKMFNVINSGDAAIAMIAKKVPTENVIKKLGIMKIDENNQIIDFDEKPSEIKEGYIGPDGMCLTNTFQFAVSKEAFKALSYIEPKLPSFGPESRDWSKIFIPVLMSLIKYDDANKCINKINEDINKVISDNKNLKDSEKEKFYLKPDTIKPEDIELAKQSLGKQKLFAIPTDEPWSDVGNLHALYQTTMQIAHNDFPLEDFERQHVIDCTNTQTGLVASSKEQKERIEAKYDINGQVMIVPQSKKVDAEIVDKYINDNLISVKQPPQKK